MHNESKFALAHFETAFKTAYDALGLPFRVDLHVWDEVPERFYEIIRGEYLALS